MSASAASTSASSAYSSAQLAVSSAISANSSAVSAESSALSAYSSAESIKLIAKSTDENGNVNTTPSVIEGELATSVGSNANAKGDNASAFGSNSVANGDNTTALGQGAQATAQSATAMGQGAQATGQSATAIGQGAQATHSNSVAIGADSTTNGEDTVSVGNDGSNGLPVINRTITNVKAGVNDTDAVNYGQLRNLEGRMENKINHVDRNLRAGIAGANAAAGLPQVYSAGKSMMALSAGTYQGQNAIAVGYSRASDNGKVVLKIQGNTNSQGKVGGSVGVGYQW